MLELCEATEENPFIHGMSRQFVDALQQLFNVMDSESLGTIKYVDLAAQWEEDEVDPYFPKGLIACLAKVTLPNGLLTFDRFCAGIKLCLLKNQVEINESKVEANSTLNDSRTSDSLLSSTLDRPSSEPKIPAPPPPPTVVDSKNTSTSSFNQDSDSKVKKLPLPSYEQVMAAKCKSLSKLPMDKIFSQQQQQFANQSFEELTHHNPHHHQQQSRLAQLFSKQAEKNLYENFHSTSLLESGFPPDHHYCSRAKSMSHLESLDCGGRLVEGEKCSTKSTTGQPKTVSRNCIMKTLQNWRDNIMNKTLPMIDSKLMASSTTASLKRNTNKRREPRRHTVGANGIDLGSIKRFQQQEQEKEILLLGLGEIEKTREWYLKQISTLQEKINLAGKSATFPADSNLDAYQERINFQATRIQNLNQHLSSLRESANTFPVHMNLAIRPLNGIRGGDPNQPKQLVVNPNLVNKLKEQNKMLTEEVGRKCERITQLEREKSSLIRELFQARTYSSYYNGDFDDTFM